MTSPAPGPRAPARQARPRLSGALVRLLASALLIVLLVRAFGLDLGQVTSRDLAGSWLSLGLAALLAQTMLGAARWDLVNRGLELHADRRSVVRILLVGLFFNQTLPSSIGGDAVRIWQLRRLGNTGTEATTSVVLDRLVALVALLPLTVLGAVRLSSEPDHTTVSRVVLGMALATAAATLALALLHRLPPGYLTGRATALRTMSAGVNRFLHRPGYVTSALALSVGIHLVTGVSVYLLARGLEVPLPMADAIVLIPLVLLVTTIPVSFAGWGLREGAMVVVLAMIGIDKGDALALSVAFGLSVMATGLPGGVLWLLGGHPTRFPTTAEPAAAAGQVELTTRR